MDLPIDNLKQLARDHGVTMAWVLAGAVVTTVLLFISLNINKSQENRTQHYAPQNIQAIQHQSVSKLNSNLIVRANLLGDATPVVIKETPKTTLNLKLQGILSATDGEIARAIIQAGNSAPKLYSIDEQISGAGAKIEEIRNTEVLLNRAGAIESLQMVKHGNDKGMDIQYTGPNSLPEDELFTPPPNAPDPDLNNFRSSMPSASANNSATNNRRRIRRPKFSGLDQNSPNGS